MYKSGQIIKTIGIQIANVPLVYHFGVILIDSSGEVFVLHNDLYEGTIKEAIESFLVEREIVEVQSNALENLTNSELLIRFNNCQGKFNVLDYNCEHFIDCMLGHKQRSEQVIIYILVGIALWLLYKKYE